MNKNAGTSGGAVFLIILILVAVFVFTVPLPHDVTKYYIEKVPYTETETYQEIVPVTYEECDTDLPKTRFDLMMRTINFLIEEDAKKFYETCENVNKLETITKTRQVTKYRDVRKSRIVTRHDALFEQWFG